MSDEATAWFVYVLLSHGESQTYVGITTEPDRRLAQHNGEQPGGAKTTHRGRPWSRGALHGPYDSRGAALTVEYRIKQRRGMQRLEPV